MPTRDSAPTGAPCWVDLSTSDTDRARDFYCQVFGWEAEEPAPEFGGYFNFTRQGEWIAGCMAAQAGAGPHDFWSTYVATDDAAKTLEVAEANRAQVIVTPMAVADLGTMAVLIDPTGAGIGLWQPGTHPGFRTLAEAGAPSWFELHTADFPGALEFYRSVFGWNLVEVSDTPEFRYSIVQDGDDQLAGLMGDPTIGADGGPPHWAVYFGSDDADATVAKVGELGGKVIRPAEDTPYGRLAHVADPMGAEFRIIAPNEAMPAQS